MPRPKFALLWIVGHSLADLFRTFKRQRITFSFVLALVVFVLAMIFSFLAFSPVLSPFVYPLF